MIVIVDYKVGNFCSILYKVKKFGIDDITISSDPNIIRNAKKLILPGVGSFSAGMKNLKEANKAASESIHKPFFETSGMKSKALRYPETSTLLCNSKEQHFSGPYRPPSAHKFRDVLKNQWIGSQFKLS